MDDFFRLTFEQMEDLIFGVFVKNSIQSGEV